MRVYTLAALLFASAGSVTARLHIADHDPDGPVPDGTTDQCTYYYTPETAAENCTYIENYWSVDHDEFVLWNPSVKDDCSGIKPGYSYCIEVNNGGQLTTTSAAPTPTGSPAPSPTPDGSASNCDKWYLVVKGDACDAVCSDNGISMKQFMEWNPVVEEDCAGLWAQYYYCVSVEGVDPSTTDSTAVPTATGPAIPGPTQTGIVKDCTDWHVAVDGDDCDGVVKQYGNLDSSIFLKWNPAVKADCSGLWLKYAYCVGTKTTPAEPPAEDPPPTGCTQNNPEPTQPGALCKCKKWHKMATGDSCYTLEQKYKITEAQIERLNPGTGCNLWKGYNVCVGA